jgi:integrase
MGVYPRRRKSGLTWCICYQVEGRQVHAVVGPDKREAERELVRRQRAIAGGTYDAKSVTGATTFGAWFALWLDARDNANANRDRVMGRHVQALEWLARLRLDDLAPRHMARVVRELAATHLAPGSVALVWGLVSTSLRDSVIAGAIPSSPCVLPRDLLPAVPRAAKDAFEGHEVAALLGDPDTRSHWRVLFAVMLYLGCREGEAAGLTWGDVKPARPLHAVQIARQWRGKPLKGAKVVGQKARTVPLHPELARMLEGWRADWERIMCRRPRPEDPILVNPASPSKEWAQNTIWTALQATCRRLGIRELSPHCLRHTAITWLRRCGARPDVVEALTHNAAGTIVDRYTHWQWDPLCEAMASLRYGATYGASAEPAGFLLCDAPPQGSASGVTGRNQAESCARCQPEHARNSAGIRAGSPTYAARHTCGPLGWERQQETRHVGRVRCVK